LKSKIILTYKKLSIPERSSTKIGLFRTICAIFGGLLVAYLAMTVLIFIIPGTPGESIVVPVLFNTMAWSFASLWISLSPSKLIALKRTFIPSLIFSLIIIIMF